MLWRRLLIVFALLALVDGVASFDVVADAGGQLVIEVEAVNGRGVLSGFILGRR